MERPQEFGQWQYLLCTWLSLAPFSCYDSSSRLLFHSYPHILSEEVQGHSAYMQEPSLEPTHPPFPVAGVLASPCGLCSHDQAPILSSGSFPRKGRAGTMEREAGLLNMLIQLSLLSRFWRCPRLPVGCHRLGPPETGKSARYGVPGHVLLLRLGPHSVFHHSSVQHP